MSFHATSPARPLSIPRHGPIVWHEGDLDEVRDAVRRFHERLRYDRARLEMLRAERQRLDEDAKQLEELLDPVLSSAPSLPAQRALSRRTLRRFVEKRRGIAQLDRMIAQLEARLSSGRVS